VQRCDERRGSRGSEVEIEILRDVYLLKEEDFVSMTSHSLVTTAVPSQLKLQWE